MKKIKAWAVTGYRDKILYHLGYEIYSTKSEAREASGYENGPDQFPIIEVEIRPIQTKKR